jgi:hypothetical protein
LYGWNFIGNSKWKYWIWKLSTPVFTNQESTTRIMKSKNIYDAELAYRTMQKKNLINFANYANAKR